MGVLEKYGVLALIIILVLSCSLPIWSEEEQQPDENTTETAQESESTEVEDETSASIDSSVSVWSTDKEEDSSKAEEYGEVPAGFLIDFLKADVNMKDDRFLGIRAKNIGLNNGQYAFDYGVSGAYDIFVNYTKIPHLFSKDGETIWAESSPGTWALADSTQGAIQGLNDVPTDDPTYESGLAAQRSFISSLLLEAVPADLGLQRNRGTVGANFSMNTRWKYGLEYFRENRDGYRPIGATLGFSWAQELPERIDYNTDRVRASAEYANNGRVFSAAYEFLSFNNENQAMIWDNPLRLNDRAEQSAGDGTSRGQQQLPADNHGNSISFAGATPLGTGKISGAFNYNNWKDEVDLLPYTINSALDQVALPSSTFNGEFRNIHANLRYYVPVGANGNFTANYRLYDQSNQNDELLFTAFSAVDASVSLEEKANQLFAYRTNTLDFDYHHKLSDSWRAFAGYSFNRWDRDEREVDKTNTNSFRAGINTSPSDRFVLQAKYQYDRRRSDEFDLHFDVYDVIPLRRFDTADLNRNLLRVTATYSPNDASTLGVTGSLQNNDYTNSAFGLQELHVYTIGADFSWAVSPTSSVNAWYEHAQNTTDQLGRQSGSTPSTSDTFDWSANIKDKFDTFGVGYLMNFSESKYAWNTDFIYATANGLVDLEAGSAVRATGAVDIPNADDTDHYSLKTGVSIKAFPRARFAIGYWFDQYSIDDFSEDGIQTDLIVVTVQTPTGPSTSTPGIILLDARQGDYTYHTGWIAFIYSW